MKSMVIAGIVFIVALALLYLRARAKVRRGVEKVFLDAVRVLDPILHDLEAGKEPNPAGIHDGAANSRTRNELWGMLMFHKRLDLFPKNYLTWESIAESEMVSWLCHPNELGCAPDEIELTSKIPVLEPDQVTTRCYFVFRFRMHPPHWAAKEGWLAGVSGPHNLKAELVPNGNHTFSRFDPYERYTPEEHVSRILKLTGNKK